jgi:hypothetical protein
MPEDWFRGYAFDQGIQGIGAGRSPDEGCILLCEIMEWSHDTGESLDKRSLVAQHSQGASYFFLIFELSGPLGNAFDFSGVNLDLPSSYKPSQDFHSTLFKLALLWFEEVGLFFHKVKELVNNLGMKPSSFLVVSCGDPPVVHVVSYVFRVLLQQ